MAMVTSIDQKKRLSTADFLEALEARLAALKPAELRAILMAHAETLPAAERGAFLAIFELADEAGKAGGKRRPRRATDAERLLRDIDALVEQCGEGRHEGQEKDWEDGSEDDDWDHYEPAHATWPRAKIDALFERADAVFRAGDLALAREAYGKLFELVGSYGEDGFEADEEESEPVGTTDLNEAKARYLRALYETTDAAQRPSALLKALQDLQFVGGSVGIPEMIGARRASLPDREAFLDAWIELLRQRQSDQAGFITEARRLLFQAVRLHQGTEGLAELARRDGRRLPEAYRKWVQALAEEGQADEAVRAAQEALRALPPTGEIRAWLAEFIAEAAAKNNDAAARLEARREAFRATPTLARLSYLCEAAEPLGQLNAVVHAETAQVRTTVAKQTKQKGQDPVERLLGQRLLATLLLLDGETEEAIVLAQRVPVVGWSGGEHPGPVVMPYLLCAAAGGAEPAAGTALAEMWRGIDADELRFPLWDLDALDGDFEDEPEAPWPDTSPTPRPVRLTPFLRTQIERQPVDPEERTRFLKVAWTLAERRVKEILDKKHRRAYERAAMLVGAVAEARIMAGDAGGGNALLSNVRQQFSRFSAFTRELDKTTRRSPLLPSPSPKPRRW
jgi:tetratricopeptide (TPR) repeat protein